MQIRKFKNKDREKIIKILNETNMFTEEEINVAIEVIDDFLARQEESGYEIYSAVDDEDASIGYICFGKRPLTQGTYDVYWIAVDPSLQGNGIGKKLMKFAEQKIKEKGGNVRV